LHVNQNQDQFFYLGKDTTIEFEDFLNNQQDSEIMGQPHVMIERQLGMM
jgi:hypothetical protein